MDGIDRHMLQPTEAGLMRKSWDANAIGGWQSLAIVDRGPEVADFPRWTTPSADKKDDNRPPDPLL